MKTLLLITWMLAFLLDQALSRLNLRHQQRHAGHIPAAFRNHFDPATIERALAYETDRQRLDLFEAALLAVLFACFMFGGWLPLYDAWTISLSGSFLWQGLLFFLGLMILRQLLDLPFSWYRNFRIETRYGFNTMTPRLWLTDQAKGFVLSLLLAGLLIAGALWLVRVSPAAWWLWVWGFITCFSLFVMVIAPYLIEPLFFKFSPVQKPELEESIRRMAKNAGLRAGRVFQVDASRRSRHGNAYFTGLGRQKRIVLFDTLLEGMNDAEVLAILAHEIGHWKYRHIPRRLAANSLLVLGALLVSRQLIAWGGLPGLLNLPAASFAAQVMILALLASIVAFPLAPLGSALSRRHERQADRFACELTGRPADLAEALIKLARDNLAALHPHPLYAWLHYSHPPLVDRVARLRNMARNSHGPTADFTEKG